MTVQMDQRAPLVVLFIILVSVAQVTDSTSDPREEFYHHQVSHFQILDAGSSKSKAFSNELTISFKGYGRNFMLKLFKNSDLLPQHYFEKYVSNKTVLTHKPMKKLEEHCHYQGYIEGLSHSWVALSTCMGLSGIIFDGVEVYYVHPNHDSKNSSSHFIFKETHRKKSKFSCGYQKFNSSLHSAARNIQNHVHRRSIGVDPYKNSKAQYLELILVMDYNQFRKMGLNKDMAFLQIVQVANILYGMYSALDIFISLVGVVIWSERNEAVVTTSAEETLSNFLKYRASNLSPAHPNDNAQLLTGIKFNGDVVGKAFKGTMCSSDNSGGVNMFHSNLPPIVAATVAHEMGHNFGVDHDSTQCYCTDGRCIMASSSSSTPALYWSNCSRKQLKQSFNQGLNFCLQNVPNKVEGPTCGNGYVEKGEECDCGLQQFCNTPCCNATTCQLVPNATCATGSCCDIKNCQVIKISTLCRAARGYCDLPEYCDGVSKFCPPDVYVQDGTECNNEKAYCYAGQCRSHLDQCHLLWGLSSSNGPKECYNANKDGNRGGDCGYDFFNKTYKRCNLADIFCGRLHCVSRSQRLKFGQNSTLITYLKIGQLNCQAALIDMGLNVDDQGLVPNGAKCGKQKVCFNQKCIPVSKMKKSCLYDCGTYGICNSNNNCHCDIGLSPPYCSSPGVGGSVDSGPPSDPYAYYEFMVALLIIFLGIIPFSVIIACTVYYSKGFLKTWWTSKMRLNTFRSHNSGHAFQQKNDHNRHSSGPCKAKTPVISNPVPIVNKQLGNNKAAHNKFSPAKSEVFDPFKSSHKESLPVLSVPSPSGHIVTPLPMRPAPSAPSPAIAPTPARPAPPVPCGKGLGFPQLSTPSLNIYSNETSVQFPPKQFLPSANHNISIHSQLNSENSCSSASNMSAKTGAAQQYLEHLSSKQSSKQPREILPSSSNKCSILQTDDAVISQKPCNDASPVSTDIHKSTSNASCEYIAIFPSENNLMNSANKTPLSQRPGNVASLAKRFQQNSEIAHLT